MECMPGFPSWYFLDEEDFGYKYTPKQTKQRGKDCNSFKTVLNDSFEHTDVFFIELYHIFIKEPSFY